MNGILEQIDVLIDYMKHTKEYLRFHELKSQLAEDEALYTRTNEFRKQSYLIQNSEDRSNIFNQIEELQDQYYDVMNHPLVYELLALENSLCELYRKVYQRIAEDIEFDISFLD